MISSQRKEESKNMPDKKFYDTGTKNDQKNDNLIDMIRNTK